LSLAYELKCFSIREKVLPPDDQSIGKSLSRIGLCYEQLNQLNQALDYYKRALGVYEQCLPLLHGDRSDIESKIARISVKIEAMKI
jgi:tetratricopeptide (TPR) repeat protein